MSSIETLLKRDRAIVAGAILLLFILAAAYSVFGVGMEMSALRMTEMRHMRDMPGPRIPGDWSLVYVVLVFLMWWVMMVAMMLPSATPAILLYAALHRRTRGEQGVPLLTTWFTMGYLLAWAGFSLFAVALQWGLEAAGILSGTMMTLIDIRAGAIVLTAAGIYQFTPLKSACLRHCQAPAEFISSHWRSGTVGALRMGLEHGTYCVSCCWFLMALLYFGGIMNLFWIAGLAAFVAMEKLVPWQGTGRLAGVILLAWGAWVLFASL